jgi:hypothetical protein
MDEFEDISAAIDNIEKAVSNPNLTSSFIEDLLAIKEDLEDLLYDLGLQLGLYRENVGYTVDSDRITCDYCGEDIEGDPYLLEDSFYCKDCAAGYIEY